MNNIPFKKADILLPKENFEKWAVIACDQFTSAVDYWNETKNIVGDAYSTYHITLPEIYLEEEGVDKRIEAINEKMVRYINDEVFAEYKNSLIYIERVQPDGRVRQGVVGAVDLEAYDFKVGSQTPVRATEGTVIERIPPRVEIRKNAPLELPHIMLLIDDIEKTVVEPLADKKGEMKILYDFELMMGGGHITGYLINEKDADEVLKSIGRLTANEEKPLTIAVGDGNHSLATAKVCYENIKKVDTENASEHPARYALAELGNIHSSALDFEPIYRVLFSVNPENVVSELNNYFKTKVNGNKITYFYGEKEGSITVDIPSDKISVGAVQEFIDWYISKYPDAKVDYIHGVEDTKKLASKENTIGFIYDGISKETLFSSVKATGALPRKTFSMGEGRDKRYYIECRKIK